MPWSNNTIKCSFWKYGFPLDARCNILEQFNFGLGNTTQFDIGLDLGVMGRFESLLCMTFIPKTPQLTLRSTDSLRNSRLTKFSMIIYRSRLSFGDIEFSTYLSIIYQRVLLGLDQPMQNIFI